MEQIKNNNYRDYVGEYFDGKVDPDSQEFEALINVSLIGMRTYKVEIERRGFCGVVEKENREKSFQATRENLDLAIELYERREGIKFLYEVSESNYHIYNQIYGERASELFLLEKINLIELEDACEKMLKNVARASYGFIQNKTFSADSRDISKYIAFGLKLGIFDGWEKDIINSSFHNSKSLDDFIEKELVDDFPRKTALELVECIPKTSANE